MINSPKYTARHRKAMTIYNKLVEFITAELTTIAGAEALISTAAMTFVFIDTFAFLSMPTTQNENGRNDFISWVNTYLKTDSSQEYQYTGIDLYGARCSLLHAFGSISEYAIKNGCRYFCYHDGPKHLPDNQSPLVLLSVNLNFLKLH
jgi:hypothetical protein